MTEHIRLPTEIFVFGSNLRGRHGAGAALYAFAHCDAELGVGVGRTGQAYALPTKDYSLNTLPLATIRQYATAFCEYAARHPKEQFFLTRVGCGLAGYTDADIAPLFLAAPPNVRKPPGW